MSGVEGRFGPPITLILLTAFLPELLTGSTLAPAMFSGSFMVFLAAYGLPILTLREIAVRVGAGPVGIAVMGLGYGLLNEGLYARTIFRATGSPIAAFDGMPMVGGVNLAFTAFILCWHAITSVVLPIVLTDLLWPDILWPERGRLLGRRALIGVGLVSMLAATAVFVLTGQAMDRQAEADAGVGMAGLIWLWIAIVGCVALGARIGAGSPGTGRGAGGGARRAAAVAVGLGGIVPFLVAIGPAQAGGPLWLSLAVTGGAVAAYAWVIARVTGGVQRLLGWVAVGWYGQTALFSAIFLIAVSPVSVMVNAGAMILVILIARVGDR